MANVIILSESEKCFLRTALNKMPQCEDLNITQIIKKFEAFPFYADISGTAFLTIQGSILFYDDFYMSITPISPNDPTHKNLLDYAARTFIE